MHLDDTPEPEPSVQKRAFSIRVFGVGGAGCNAVDHLAGQGTTDVEFAVMNTDATALAHAVVPTKLLLGSKLSRGLGAGGDLERGRAAAEEDAAAVRALSTGADIVFVVAGLGGGTGTGAAPVVARVAKESGALVLGIVILPFDCEGPRRARMANLGLHELKSAADGVICLPNQKVFKLIDENTSLLEAFKVTNQLVEQAIRGIWRLLSRPGLIGVDFAALCAVTQGRHAEGCLAIAEAHGENRAREVTERLLAHPLLDEGALLAEAAGVLLTIAGGQSLSLAEVNRIMEQVGRQCEHAQITMGAAIDETLGDRIVVTLVASRRGPSEPSELGVETQSLESTRLDEGLLPDAGRPASRFVAPPPTLSPAKTEELFAQQNLGNGRSRKGSSRLKQGQLPLEIISKGRFEKSEPTIHLGQDLDVPTYIRRGVALN